MIVLLTDFGTKDQYIGEMKAVIHYIEPSVHIIDLTHEVEPGNIKHGQFFLKYSCNFFPKNTIFVGVVDPGVGGNRQGIAVNFHDRWFIGPDNGLLSFAKEGSFFKIKGVTNPITNSISNTFHGRDIFAPASAYLYQGKGEFFERIENINTENQINEITEPDKDGEVLHIDRFGNIVTNITANLLDKVVLILNGIKIDKYYQNFEAGKDKGVFTVPGSRGLIEIACFKKKASEVLKAKIGDKINVKRRE